MKPSQFVPLKKDLYAICGLLMVPVPEPSTGVLFGSGSLVLAALTWIRRRRTIAVAGFAILVLLGVCGPTANAGTISSLFSTGVDNSGMPLPDGPIGAGAIGVNGAPIVQRLAVE